MQPDLMALQALIGSNVQTVVNTMTDSTRCEATTSLSRPDTPAFSVGGSRSMLAPDVVTIVVAGLSEERVSKLDLGEQLAARDYQLLCDPQIVQVGGNPILIFTINILPTD